MLYITKKPIYIYKLQIMWSDPYIESSLYAAFIFYQTYIQQKYIYSIHSTRLYKV